MLYPSLFLQQKTHSKIRSLDLLQHYSLRHSQWLDRTKLTPRSVLISDDGLIPFLAFHLMQGGFFLIIHLDSIHSPLLLSHFIRLHTTKGTQSRRDTAFWTQMLLCPTFFFYMPANPTHAHPQIRPGSAMIHPPQKNKKQNASLRNGRSRRACTVFSKYLVHVH